MKKITFMPNDYPTLGIELEFGLVNKADKALVNAAPDVLKELPPAALEFCKPELMQSCVEVNSGVCRTVREAESDLREKVMLLEGATDTLGLDLWWGGTHPFSHWQQQRVTNDPRYLQLVEQLQQCAKRLVCFGLHVHVGVDSGEKAVMICNRIMRHLPLMLALTNSSPFWENSNTGLQSFRSKIMEQLPTAGLPTLMRNWSEYVWLVHHLIDTGFIHTIREIWWDVRPHHNFGTVEIRICDMPGNLKDVLAVAALSQCLVKALSDEIDAGTYQHNSHPMMVRQNKWRAARYGTSAQLVHSFTYQVQSVPNVIDDLVCFLRPIAEELGCFNYLQHCSNIANTSSWADRQIAILEATGDPKEIVGQLTAESRILPVPVGKT